MNLEKNQHPAEMILLPLFQPRGLVSFVCLNCGMFQVPASAPFGCRVTGDGWFDLTVSSLRMWVAHDGARTIAPVGCLPFCSQVPPGTISHLLPTPGGMHRHCIEVVPFISLTKGIQPWGSPSSYTFWPGGEENGCQTHFKAIFYKINAASQ